ncbi:DUF4097 domain-containing protein [Fibrella sp. WM1]|uniref:DUF4097 family beta strand repeat-containing protein n=1 Tax=Fibrella musci TaxID=3242485 RepID=UPI0035204A4A
MKHFIFPVLAGVVLSCTHSVAQSTEHNEHISRQFTPTGSASASVLVIYNIQGFVHVAGTSGNTVGFEVDKKLTAKDPKVLEAGKQEFKLQFEQRGDTIMAYIAEPFDSRPNRNNWQHRNERRIEYNFNLDFTVTVPAAMNVQVSTVNKGDVSVRDVAGRLKVTNVNGGITLNNVRGATNAHTINGNLIADYLASPPEGSSYYTLNGDIKVSYPANLAADLQFKTFQGHFNTDFPEVEILPARVTKTQENRGDKTVYKLDKTTAIRIGGGGNNLRFETFNGNVYIKKQS